MVAKARRYQITYDEGKVSFQHMVWAFHPMLLVLACHGAKCQGREHVVE